MNFKKYINTVIPHVQMDDKQGYFQDLNGSNFDIKIGKLIGDVVVEEYSSMGFKLYRPVYTQKVELEYLKDGNTIHNGLGFFYREKYSKTTYLYSRGLATEEKFSFGVVL